MKWLGHTYTLKVHPVLDPWNLCLKPWELSRVLDGSRLCLGGPRNDELAVGDLALPP